MNILLLFCKHGKQQNQIMHDDNCKQEKIKNQMKCFSWPENIKDTNRDCLPLILVFLKAFLFSLFLRFFEIIQSSADDKT